MPPAPPGYVDSSILMTGMLKPPFAVQKIAEGDAQIFRVGLRAQGRRVAERLMLEIKIAGASINRFPAMPILGAGYGTFQVDPYYVRAGEKVDVIAQIEPRGSWWVRLIDRIWDWWEPPKAMVILTGVVRKEEES